MCQINHPMARTTCRYLICLILTMSLTSLTGTILPHVPISTSSAIGALGAISGSISDGIRIRSFEPIAVLKRFPSAFMLSGKESITSFVQTAGIMVPAGLIWKIGTLKSLGIMPWLLEGGKMGVEWGRFSGLYAGGQIFFRNMRLVDDKYNSYIACGLCSAASKINMGPRVIFQEFATGYAFVYALDQLAAMVGANEIEGRQAIEGAVGKNIHDKGMKGKGMGSKVKVSKAPPRIIKKR